MGVQNGNFLCLLDLAAYYNRSEPPTVLALQVSPTSWLGNNHYERIPQSQVCAVRHHGYLCNYQHKVMVPYRDCTLPMTSYSDLDAVTVTAIIVGV